MSHLGIKLKCRFWFCRSWVGQVILHFETNCLSEDCTLSSKVLSQTLLLTGWECFYLGVWGTRGTRERTEVVMFQLRLKLSRVGASLLAQWQRIRLQCRRRGSIRGSGRSPGEGNGYPLQYSSLENLTDRRAWWATVHGVAKSRTWLSD